MSRHNPENSAENRKGMCASEHACVCKKREGWRKKEQLHVSPEINQLRALVVFV